MRQTDPQIKEERKKKILQAIVHCFVKTAKPVGSQVLTEEYKFNLSSATIRNLMAELEEEGYLMQPHTSAGRVPTDKGYRFYVDSLIEIQKLIIQEEERVRREYKQRIQELNDLLSQTSKVLSILSHYTGFVFTPKIDISILKYIELVPIDLKRIMVIIVTHTGLIKHNIIEAYIPRERISYLNRFLNDKLTGLTILEAKEKILNKIEEFRNEEMEILSIIRSIQDKIFQIDQEIYLEGTSNVLSLPDFQDFEPVKCLLKIGEQKNLLSKILEDDLNSDRVKVLIGSETSCEELKHMAVVSTVYKDSRNPIGILGIIGPKRMEYQRMMAIVSAVSKIVNKLLNKLGGLLV